MRKVISVNKPISAVESRLLHRRASAEIQAII